MDYLFLGQFGVITDENELSFMNDRYYTPYLGRFLNEDPYSLRYNDITNLNLYGYCGNDPINNVDPSGNFFETLFDVFSVAYSAADFFSDPTASKLATLAWDTAAAVLPFIPGSYVKKRISLTDDAFDLVKGGSALGKGFDNFIDVKKFLGSAGEGNQWHHIVEQSQIQKSGFGSHLIQNTDKLIAVDKVTHAKISQNI